MDHFLFAADSMDPWLVGSLIVGGFVLLCVLIFLLRFFRLWIQSYLTGAEISFLSLIRMELTKLDPSMIVHEKIKLTQAGIREVSSLDLEAHALAKGNVPKVVSALIAARKAGTPLSWKEAADRDLAGEGPPDQPLVRIQELRDRYGLVVSALQPAGKVDFGDCCADALAEGSNVDAAVWVRCVEIRGSRVIVRPVELAARPRPEAKLPVSR